MAICQRAYGLSGLVRDSVDLEVMAQPSASPLRAARSHQPTLKRSQSHRYSGHAVPLCGLLVSSENFSRYGVFAVDRVIDTNPTTGFPGKRALQALSFVAKKIDSLSEERSRTRAHLMARMQDGDAESCRALLDDIGPMLTNFLRRRIAGRDDLEDVYQETVMAFFQARRTYDPSRPLEPWLFAIARNVAADHARRYWTRASVEQLTDTMPEQANATEPRSDPSLEDVMARLPDQQREAFSMLKLEGLSIEQAAKRAGTSVGTLRVRAHRAYKTLRKIIGE
jgi:RNA polymerase sigma-70 factor, ECF subfamily